MPSPNDNVLNIAVTIDASQVNSGMERARQEIEAEVRKITSEINRTNADLRLTPKTDTSKLEDLRDFKNRLSAQKLQIKADLADLTQAFEINAARIAEAQKVLKAPLQRENGKFVKRDKTTPAYVAADLQFETASNAQAQILERMTQLREQALKPFADLKRAAKDLTATVVQGEQEQMTALARKAALEKQVAGEKKALVDALRPTIEQMGASTAVNNAVGSGRASLHDIAFFYGEGIEESQKLAESERELAKVTAQCQVERQQQIARSSRVTREAYRTEEEAMARLQAAEKAASTNYDPRGQQAKDLALAQQAAREALLRREKAQEDELLGVHRRQEQEAQKALQAQREAYQQVNAKIQQQIALVGELQQKTAAASRQAADEQALLNQARRDPSLSGADLGVFEADARTADRTAAQAQKELASARERLNEITAEQIQLDQQATATTNQATAATQKKTQASQAAIEADRASNAMRQAVGKAAQEAAQGQTEAAKQVAATQTSLLQRTKDAYQEFFQKLISGSKEASEAESSAASQAALAQKQAATQIKSEIAAVKNERSAAYKKANEEAKALASAQAILGQFAAKGNKADADALAEIAERGKAATASVQVLDDKLDELKLKLKEVQQQAEGAGEKMSGSFYKVSAMSQIFGLKLGRAMEMVLSKIPLIAQAMDAIFPVMAAGMLVEMLIQIGEKVWDWATGLERVKEYNDTIGRQLQEQNQEVAKLVQQQKEAHFQYIGAKYGQEAEHRARSLDDTDKISQAQIDRDQAKANFEAAKKRRDQDEKLVSEWNKNKDQHTFNTPGGVPITVGMTSEVAEAKKRLEGPVNHPEAAEDEASFQSAVSNLNIADHKLATLQEQKKAQDALADKSGRKTDKSAYSKMLAELRRKDKNELAQKELSHDDGEMTVEEKIAFWEDKLKKERGLAERVMEIQDELAALHQQQLRQRTQDKISKQTEAAGQMEREDGSADYAAQEQAWANFAEANRNNRTAYQHALEQAARAHVQAMKQAQQDAVRSDEESFLAEKGERTMRADDIKAWWSKIVAEAEHGSLRYRNAVKHVGEAQAQKPKEELQDRLATAEEQHQSAQNGYSQRQAEIESRFNMSAQLPRDRMRELQDLKKLHAEMLQEEIRYRTAMAQLASLGNNPERARKELDALQQYQRKANLERVQDDKKINDQMTANLEKYLHRASADFNSAVSSWMNGQQKFSQSMAKMWNGLVTQLADSLLQMAEQWLIYEAKTMLAHLATNQLKVASDKTAAVQSEGISIAQHFKEDLRTAKSAAKKAWDATVGIPIVGPILAPIAAAGTFAAVMAFEKGGFVPNQAGGVPAVLHANEMVLPAKYAQPFKSMVDNGAAGGGGAQASGNVYVGNWPTVQKVQAIDNTEDQTGRSLGDRLAVAMGGPAADIKDSLQTLGGLLGPGGKIDGSTAARALYVKMVKPGGVLGGLVGMIPGMGNVSLPFFEQGGIVPSTDLAMLHKNEMVLPSHLSQGLQGMIAGGGPAGGGATHLHYAPQVTSYGAGGLGAMLKEHAAVIHGIVRQGMRNGALPSPSF